MRQATGNEREGGRMGIYVGRMWNGGLAPVPSLQQFSHAKAGSSSIIHRYWIYRVAQGEACKSK